MKPLARTEKLVVREIGDGLQIWDEEQRQEFELHAVTAAVWRHADGQRTVAELAELVAQQLGMAADEDLIWAALDRLADARLLAARLAPPAAQPFSRRNLLRRVGVAAALAVAAALPATPAAGQTGGQQEQNQKQQEQKQKQGQEQKQKQQEQKQKQGQEQKQKEQKQKSPREQNQKQQEQKQKQPGGEQKQKEQKSKQRP
jgi:flagellar biosynthesis GTPase FlhF